MTQTLKMFARYDFLLIPTAQVSPSTPRPIGPKKLRAGPWTPITAGWRSYFLGHFRAAR
jgi:hypothetical protein